MSDKWIVFNESIPFLTEKEFYPVVTEQSHFFEIIDDDIDMIYIAKEESTYDYEVFEKYPLSDNVTNPSHYTNGNIETIDYLKDTLSKEQYECFCRGNVLKYLSRYPHKNGVEDLNKAKTYLQWLIDSVKG